MPLEAEARLVPESMVLKAQIACELQNIGVVGDSVIDKSWKWIVFGLTCKAGLGCGWFGSGESWLRFLWLLVEGR